MRITLPNKNGLTSNNPFRTTFLYISRPGVSIYHNHLKHINKYMLSIVMLGQIWERIVLGNFTDSFQVRFGCFRLYCVRLVYSDASLQSFMSSEHSFKELSLIYYILYSHNPCDFCATADFILSGRR